MKPVLSLLLLFAFAPALMATPVITSTVACSANGIVGAVVSGACSVHAGDVTSTAHVDWSVVGLGTTSVTAMVGGDVGMMQGGSGGLPTDTGSAFASISMTVPLYVNLPICPPLQAACPTLAYVISADADGSPGAPRSASAMISLGGGCTAPLCAMPISSYTFAVGATPFNLFLSTLGGPVVANGNPLGGSGGGSASVHISITDTSGNPVQIFAVPEPGTWLLLVVGLVGLALRAATESALRP